jgi:hypothetical protein
MKYESGDEIDAGGSEDGPDTADRKDDPKLMTRRTPTQNCKEGHTAQQGDNTP